MSLGSTRTAVYSVRDVSNATPDEWDGWLEASPGGGHVLQSHEWGEFKKALGWKPIRLLLERDGEVAGCGQFLSYGTGPFVPGSLWYCTKGPWLPDEDEEAVQAFYRGVREAARQVGVHTVKIEPEITEDREGEKRLLQEIGFQKARYDLNHKTTMIVDLNPSEEELLARMKGKTRYNARLAARKGVEVVERDLDEYWETFYALLEVTAERNGFVIRRSKTYLYDSMKAMQDAGRGHLLLAEHDGGQPLAGVFVFTFGEKCWYIHGVSTNEKRNLMPTYLLQWEVMRRAKQRSMTYYDMVAVPRPENLDESDPLWGVYKFKQGFGGEVHDFLGCLDMPVRPLRAAAWYRFEPVYYRLYQKLKNEVFY